MQGHVDPIHQGDTRDAYDPRAHQTRGNRNLARTCPVIVNAKSGPDATDGDGDVVEAALMPPTG